MLLTLEGVNVAVAGERAAMDRYKEQLQSVLRRLGGGAGTVPFHTTFATKRPFEAYKVRVKDEAITFRGIAPVEEAPRVSPESLARSLAAGEDVLLVDTRNDYECSIGTFRGAAVYPNLRHFDTFPAAAGEKLDEILPALERGAKVVSFCTGGIRCEKAAPYLNALIRAKTGSASPPAVAQLHGGIINYFDAERALGVPAERSAFEGSLFVFDQRIAIDRDGDPLFFSAKEGARAYPSSEMDPVRLLESAFAQPPSSPMRA